MPISNLELNEYQQNGFVFKKNFFDNNEIFTIRKWVYDYAERKPEDWENGKEMAYYETSKNDKTRILARIEKFVDYHEGFKKLVNSRALIECVDTLLGEPSILFKEKINFKKPGGGGFHPHQDMISRWDDFANDFMNVLIITDDTNLENGCLELAAGFHNKGFLGPYDAPIPEKYLEKMEFVPYQLSMGDVVFFNGFTPHQSQDNKSTKPRSNVYLTYNKKSEGDQRNSYFMRKRKELPPDNERNDTFKDSPLHEYK